MGLRPTRSHCLARSALGAPVVFWPIWVVAPSGSATVGKRRWRVMGDPEDGWWVEVDSDGSELPGDWEYDRKGGYVYCSFS